MRLPAQHHWNEVCNEFAILDSIAGMGQLTTHVLDLATGVPAAGVRIELYEERGSDAAVRIASVKTGESGRVASPLVAGAGFRAGRYTLKFRVAEYFRGRGVSLPEPAFLEEAVITFGVADPAQHYHVPLLITPWSYSVYRGG
jgi:5-hydroxyisourate hydrolase